MLYLGLCQDETPSGRRFVRESMLFVSCLLFLSCMLFLRYDRLDPQVKDKKSLVKIKLVPFGQDQTKMFMTGYVNVRHTSNTRPISS